MAEVEDSPHRSYLRFACAAVIVAVAFLLRQAMVRFIGAELPSFITFYPAIMVAALLCGRGPGLLATALSALVADYWLLPPQGSLAIANPAEAIALALFAAMGVFICLVVEAYRRNQRRVAALKGVLALHESKQKLQQSEEQFATLANAIPQLCWMAIPDGHIFWYNQRWYEYTGTTPEQMQGWGWQSVHDPEVLPKVLERWKSSIATGEPFDMVFPLRGADGVFRQFLTRVMPVKDAGGKILRWFGTNTDISEQKRAEIELRKSKERLDLAVEVAGLGEWELNLKDGTASHSMRHAQIFGYSSPPPDWSYARFLDHVLPELRDSVNRQINSGDSWSIETQVRRADGEVRWIWVRGRRRVNDVGQLERMYGVVTDITERKQAEQERVRLAAIVDSSGDAIIGKNLEGMVSSWNQSAEQMFGYSAQEMIGQPITRIIPPERHVEETEFLERLRRGGCVDHYDTVRLNKQGHRVDVSVTLSPIYDSTGAVVGISKIVRDITERKQAEEALRQSLERLEKVLDVQTVGVMFWDLNTGCMVDANDTFLKLMGYSRSQVEARELNWQTLTPPEYIDVSRAEVAKFLATGRVGPYEKEYFCKDGTRRWLLFAGSSLGNNQCVEFCVDITDRKQAEEAVRSSEAKLQALVSSAIDAIISVDDAQRIVVFNRAAEQIFQCPAAEALGSKIDRFIPERLREVHSKHIRRFEEQGITNRSMSSPGMLRGLRSNGEEFPIEATISQVRADGQTLLTVILRDITERKQAEEALRLRGAALDAAANSIVMTDAAGSIQWVNAAFTRLTGYTAEEAIGQNPRVLKSGKHGDHFYKQMWQKVLSGSSWRGELINRRKDGSLYVEEMTITPVRAADGSISNFLAVKEDVTERKRAEEALEESEERLRLFIEHAPAALAMFDREMRYLQVSRRWRSDYALDGRDMSGISHYDVFPEISEQWKEAHRRGLAGEVLRSEADRFVRPDGSVQWIRWEIRPWYGSNGEVGGIVIFAEDITERKRSEQALQASEHRWSTTLQSIGDAVISTDPVGKIDFLNDVAQTLTGWTLAEARGRDLTDVFDIIQEVTRIRPESPVAKVIRLGKIVGLANHTVLIHRDGTEIPIEDSAAPIRDSMGRMEGVVLVFHDCLEQRKVEAALRSNERLATTGRLAATIAHEIHNPLDAVGNLLFLIREESKDDSTREYASMAGSELARVTQMTQQMLGFQREATRPVPVKIGEVLANVLALYDRKIKTAGIRLEQKIDQEAQVVALPGELRQIFANLLGNAIEAVGSRRGTIALRAYPSQDRRRGVPGLCVVVADNGPGIPPGVRGKIFEPFFTTKGESGTGLGLWITSDILRKYDGTMRLRTCTHPERSGTCFSIFLPFQINSEPTPSS